jgi:hypothetical protein
MDEDRNISKFKVTLENNFILKLSLDDFEFVLDENAIKKITKPFPLTIGEFYLVLVNINKYSNITYKAGEYNQRFNVAITTELNFGPFKKKVVYFIKSPVFQI